ncbi:hypothetical protein AX16_005238 [Volvariella volvacea WC 439]|nr:hypothetical protein AX16_005238 [Volvariella volvacea WC 439]
MASAPRAIIDKLPTAYETALQSGDLLFFPSTTHPVAEGDVEWEVSLCPSISHKPQGSGPSEVPEKAKDPFEPPYNEKLFLGEVGYDDEEYAVILNKYSIIPHHFLLVTKEFKSQTSPLTPADLVQTYQFLVAAQRAGRHFFAFYNCGDLSGSSQPHKHIQFLPCPPEGPPVERVARLVNLETPTKPFNISKLPYANHSYRFPSGFSGLPVEKQEETLSLGFMLLLDLVISTIRHEPNYPVGRPSYNIVITLEHIHATPRLHDTYTFEEGGNRLPVNGAGSAGLLLARTSEELEQIKKTGTGKILRGVGLESVHDLQVAGEHAEPAL